MQVLKQLIYQSIKKLNWIWHNFKLIIDHNKMMFKWVLCMLYSKLESVHPTGMMYFTCDICYYLLYDLCFRFAFIVFSGVLAHRAANIVYLFCMMLLDVVSSCIDAFHGDMLDKFNVLMLSPNKYSVPRRIWTNLLVTQNYFQFEYNATFESSKSSPYIFHIAITTYRYC